MFTTMLGTRSYRGVLLVPALVLLGGLPSFAEAAPAKEGLFVAVPTPITGEAITRLEAAVNRALKRENRPVQTIIFDFNPPLRENGKETGRFADAETRNYGVCYDLATVIRNLSRNNRITTVALVRGKVSRHTVLPVLACSDIVMGSEGAIGEIVDPNAPTLNPTEATFYKEVAEARFPFVARMFDKNVEILKAQLETGGFIYIQAGEQDKPGILNSKVVYPINGTLGLFKTKQAIEFGLCKFQLHRNNKQELAEVYGLPPGSLREDPLQGREPVAYHIVVNKRIDSGMRARLRRQIQAVINQKANFIILEIESNSGDPIAAREIADDFLKLQAGEGEQQPVMLVAYYPDEAAGVSTFLGLACSEIVMRRMNDQEKKERDDKQSAYRLFGDFESYLANPAQENEAEGIRKSLREIAEAQGYPPVLIDGMFQKDLIIHRVKGKRDQTQRRLMTEEELKAADRDWDSEGIIKQKGETLKLTPNLAEELGLVRFTIENRDVKQVYGRYGLDETKVKEAGPDWLESFAEFLRRGEVVILLLLLAICGLILELKAPGLAVPGIISALCFVLFFWSQSQNAEMTLLAVLLFILGIILLGIEIFILPGFGVAGVMGLLLLIGGLGMATMERFPQTGGEWAAFALMLMKFGLSLMGGVGLAFFLARYLPSVPYANRLMLKPPEDEIESQAAILPGASEAAALLGAIGVATTVLRPAGMARFGDSFVDVVSEGGYIEPGARVQVIEVEGTRIVVKAV